MNEYALALIRHAGAAGGVWLFNHGLVTQSEGQAAGGIVAALAMLAWSFWHKRGVNQLKAAQVPPATDDAAFRGQVAGEPQPAGPLQRPSLKNPLVSPSRLPLLLALAAGVALLGSGCAVFRPVPTTKFSAKVAGQRFEWENPKNTSMTNILVEVATNGTARLSIGAVISVNDSNVVSNAFSGETMLVHEMGQAINQAVQTGAAAAGKFVGTTAGAAVKAP